MPTGRCLDGWPRGSRHPPGHHRCYFFLDGFVCDNADPAMDFVRPLDLPSRKAADALRATTLDVCFKFLAIPTTSSADSVANQGTTRFDQICTFVKKSGNLKLHLFTPLTSATQRVQGRNWLVNGCEGICETL